MKDFKITYKDSVNKGKEEIKQKLKEWIIDFRLISNSSEDYVLNELEQYIKVI